MLSVTRSDKHHRQHSAETVSSFKKTKELRIQKRYNTYILNIFIRSNLDDHAFNEMALIYWENISLLLLLLGI